MLQFATRLSVLIENHDVLIKKQYECQYSVECCSCRKSTEWGDGLEAGASAGVGSGCFEQKNRKPDGEIVGIDLQQHKGASRYANSMVDAVGVEPSCSNEGPAGEACTRCHSLCREHATCLAENASVGSGISCQEKGGSIGSCISSQEKKCEPEWR